MRPPEPLVAVEGEAAWLRFPALDESGLVGAWFSTRRGGVSAPPFDSMNLGATTADDPVAVAENRRRFGELTGFPLQDMVLQVHGSAVVRVDVPSPSRRADAGRIAELALPEADGLVTATPGLPLTIFVADCLSLFVVDTRRRAIGLAHAGWRGTVRNMAGALLKAMAESFSTDPADCDAAIGPGLGPCCFLVDDDVAAQFRGAFPAWEDLIVAASNKWRVDLTQINRRQLQEEGIGNGRISSGTLCTSCRSDLFYSYRRDRGNTGRMAATLMLRESTFNI